MCCPNFDALLDPFPGEVCIDVLPSTLGGVGARRVVPIRGVGLVMYPLRVPDKVDRFGAICEEDGEPMLLRAGRDGETGRRGDGVAGRKGVGGNQRPRPPPNNNLNVSITRRRVSLLATTAQLIWRLLPHLERLS